MLKFIDEKGEEYLVQAEIRVSNGVNGERSITGEIHSNDKVIHAIGRGWKLEHEDEFYKIIYALPVDEGKNIVVEFDAVHQFFFDFDKSMKYAELNGSNTFDAYLNFIFKDSGYSYRNEVKVDAFEKQSFGFKSRLTLFKDIISSVGVEFVVSGKVVRIVEKVGTDLSTIVKKGFNLQDLRLEHNIGSFITYKKGYGAYIDPEDESKGRLEVEYESPLAKIYGRLEGVPVVDERYTKTDSLFTRIKKDVDNSYSVAVSLTMEDLNDAGYQQKRPVAGDYIMAINKDLDFKERVRIVSFESFFDIEGNIIDHNVSCNSLSMGSRSNNNDSWKDEIEVGLENAKQNADKALVSANGKNMTFYGAYEGGEPKATKVNDTWYKTVGEETIVYIWDGKTWVELLSTIPNTIIKEKIEELEEISKEAQEKADQAIEDAGFSKIEVGKIKEEFNNVQIEVDKIGEISMDASNKSNQALIEAEASRQTANEAKEQSFNSEQIANSAKQDAILAIAKGDQNSTQISNIEGEQKLTNTKVEGNTANILNLQTDSEKLSLSIGKVQADVENIADGGYNYQLQGNNMYHNKWIILNQTVGDISATRAVIDGYNVVTLRKHVANSGWSFFGIEKSMLVRPMDLVNNREWGLTMHIHSNKETPFRGYVQDAGSVNRSIQFEAITLQPGWQTVTMKSEIVNIESNETNNMLWFSASSWPKDTEISVAWYVQRPNTTTLKQWVPALSETIDYSKFATLEATMKGFQTTVNSDITGLQSQQTQMASQITSVVEKVDNLEIGSRNYILNSEVLKTDKNLTVYQINLERLFVLKGQFVTVSFEAKSNNEFGFIDAYLRNVKDGKGEIVSETMPKTRITSRFERYSFSFKISDDVDSFGVLTLAIRGNPTVDSSNTGKTFSTQLAKLEKGIIESDWSPAPEDNASKSEVIQLSDQITQTVNKVETVDGRVTQQQTQITQLSDQINSKVDKTDFDSLTGTVTQQGTEIAQLSDRITQTVTKIETIDGKVVAQQTQINQLSDKIELVVKEQTELNTKYSKIEQTTDAIRSEVVEMGKKVDDIGTYVNYLINADIFSDNLPYTIGMSGPQLSLVKAEMAKGNLKITQDRAFQGYIVLANNTSSLELDTEYTFSGNFKKASLDIRVYFEDNFKVTSEIVLSEDGAFSLTFRTPKEKKTYYLYIKCAGTINQTSSMSAMKLNKGSKRVENTVDTASLNARITTVEQTSTGLKTEVKDLNQKTTGMDARITTVEQTSTGLKTEVALIKDDQIVQSSQITQLSDNINLRVEKNKVISQINISPETIRLESKLIHLSGKSLIDDAVIKSAMIESMTANKLTAGIIDAAQITVINMNANNITTGVLKAIDITGSTITGSTFTTVGTATAVVLKQGLLTISHNNNGMLARFGYNSTWGQGLSLEIPKGLWITGTQSTQQGFFALEYRNSKMWAWLPEIRGGITCVNSTTSYYTADYYADPEGRAAIVGYDGVFFGERNSGGTINQLGEWRNNQLEVFGSLKVRGSKNAIHETSQGWVATPAYETAESYLGDIGTATTDENGNVVIFIDELFSEIINTEEHEYHVFLQSYRYESPVFVLSRNEKYFTVKSKLPHTVFAYELKAKRRGYETDRLKKVEE